MRRTRASRAISRRSSAAGRGARLARRRAAHAAAGRDVLHPTAVLFNGGVFVDAAHAARARYAQQLARRRRCAARAPARRRGSRSRGRARRRVLRLREARPWRAHSRRHGACVLRRDRIGDAGRAGPNRRCRRSVAPFGMEEGSDAALPPQEFGLVVGEPVQFRFFGSSVRRIRPARCSTTGRRKSCRSWRKSRRRCPPKGAPSARSCP